MIWFAFIASALCVSTLVVAFWSLKWPTTKGNIDISIFDQEWESTRSGNAVKLEKRDKFYLSYSYTVDGQQYASGRIAPLLEFDWQSNSGAISSARDKQRWYREGANVDVHYCPLYPAWACLEPGGFLMTSVLAIVSVTLWVILT